MKLNLKKTTCRVLAASVLALSFQSAQAGLIGAEQAAAAAPASADRTLIVQTLQRADVATQLAAAGVDPRAAAERVAMMTDQEVQAMVQDIQNAPAGAIDTAGWIAVLLVAGLVWYFVVRR